MSDEFGANSGFKGSLVNKSAGPQASDSEFNYQTGNYPPDNDTTSSGGYGPAAAANVWSDKAQRGRLQGFDFGISEGNHSMNDSTGLINQSVHGVSLTNGFEDAKQGRDESTRQAYGHEVRRDFGVESHVHSGGTSSLNSYGRNVDSRGDAEEMLASQYRDSRDRQFESGGAASVEEDVGAL